MAKKILFTIDGGGIRGVLPLVLLKHIQENLSKDLFSLNTSWWGTSTGALISSALSVQVNLSGGDRIQNILNLYEFRSNAAVNPQGGALPARALNQLIESNFKGVFLSDFPNLNIIASNADTLEPVLFNKNNNCLLTEAVKASCAFPGVFPPVTINGNLYVDGFYKAKNPTDIALSNCDKLGNELIVISLGTGVLRTTDDVEEQVNDTDLKMEHLAKQEGFIYFRLNPKLVNAVDGMQNTSAKNIMNLRKDGLAFIKNNPSLINNVIQALTI